MARARFSLFTIDTLLPAAIEKVVIGSFLFGRKTTYDVTVTTSQPNGQVDTDPGNDSYTAAGLLSMMTGNYSAGVISDYSKIADAIADLVLRGVCGPVTISINPGTFNEELVIPAIDGASFIEYDCFPIVNS
jgi:hypothetical protein